MATADHPEAKVVNLTGEFDASAFCRVRDLLTSAAEQIVLDFHDVRWCHPFALAELFELVTQLDGRVRTRALSQQHDVLLGYLGVSH
ncbi:MAG TPA: hypothetical protein VMB50_00770 [Myxococcales bacterium]|nr:hypothetical protein [Myxococcales bacterium]